MFHGIRGNRRARILVATLTSVALVALSVGQVFAGWTHP